MPLLVAGLTGGLILGATVGVIVGASTVPTIKACVEKDGTMRYLASGKCKSGEKLLTWNVQGPAGPKGATGAAGPPSAAGGGFYYSGKVVKETTRGQPLVAAIVVPSGDYLADAIIQVSIATGDSSVGCTMGGAVLNGGTFGGDAQFTLRSPLTFTGGNGAITVICQLDTDGTRALATIGISISAWPGPRLQVTPAPKP